MEEQFKLTKDLLFILEEAIKATEKATEGMSTVDKYTKGLMTKKYFITPGRRIIDGIKSGELVLATKTKK